MTVTSYPELAGRTAVVTGAASGMGEATARLLAAGGARVALLARRADRLTELAEKITRDGGQALVVPVDVTDQAAVDAAAAQVRTAFGQVDLVVNAAGVMLPNPMADGRSDEWSRMIDTNLTGVLRVINAFRSDLVAAAAEGRTADLVNVSSIGAHLTFPNFAVYSATKAALTHLSAVLRGEFGPLDVRVTNIEPGLTETELGDHIDNAEISAMVDGMLAAIPPLTSEDIADLIGWTTSRRRGVNLRQAIILPTRQA
ncbi:SDR family oxidoreductase [Kitasatospora kifunensis]|uniref:NADP-dependent 3-hydroxy acid dehydrogenase YdfG n=1 Tax=Kitasatospora kifunensis TaxID=58351 RepID=A0A7W7VWY2_KITKI|nr:SDR family oxidoreductase [Kitasatospora kifunensis]MBB4925020.1 NADP-dependent 3-hydroxy acid dehydrogenase YdfG [Kitasatospora kifunensis]